MDSFKVPLISDKKEGYLTLFIALVLILLHLAYIYKEYLFFKNAPFILSEAKVIYIYPDSIGYKKRVKLNSDKIGVFYTLLDEKRLLTGDKIRLFIYPRKDLSFLEFLKGSFYRVKISSITRQKSITASIAKYIAKEHNNKKLINFYQAIYLAYPLDRELRRNITAFGINHLTALSGFHLGILSMVIIFIITPIYKFFQARYFPYRSRYNDIGISVLFSLFLYLYLTSYPPSLMRAYSMMAVGWVGLILGVEIISFTTLSVAVLVLLILIPKFIVSKAFWLSVVGVMYIFILLKNFSHINSWILKLLLLPVGIFILMSPIIHSLFPYTSLYQLYSPIISVIFIIFYPLSIILHLFGMGGILDSLLLEFFTLDITLYSVNISFWLIVPYLILSILSVYKRYLLIPLFFSATSFMLYIYLSII